MLGYPVYIIINFKELAKSKSITVIYRPEGMDVLK